MTQTLCPYALTSLEAADSNDEHILPVALGAPTNFTVRAHTAENSSINELLDAPMVNDRYVRFLATSHSVESRSGPVKTVLFGVVESSGDAVKAVFGHNDVAFKFVDPMEKDDQGNVIAVRGFGDDLKRLTKQFVQGRAKKGIPTAIGATEWFDEQSMKFRMASDLFLIQRQQLKIAYLTTVRVFGDEAITGPSGQLMRAAMMADRDDAMVKQLAEGMSSRLAPGCARMLTDSRAFALSAIRVGREVPFGCARSSKPNEHAITCVLMPWGVLTSVDLFGVLQLFIVSPTDGISAEIGTGEVIRIDASTSKLTSSAYMDVQHELIQDWFKN